MNNIKNPALAIKCAFFDGCNKAFKNTPEREKFPIKDIIKDVKASNFTIFILYCFILPKKRLIGDFLLP